MVPAAVLLYLAQALGYAIPAAAAVLGLTWAGGARPTPARAALALATGFVVFLAISPFPDPARLDCDAGGPTPRLVPFGFLADVARLWRNGAPLSAWATDLTVTSTVMNLVFFALVGAALATQTRRTGHALLFAAFLSGGIETAQITGLFGVYPCAYRVFDVDDLMLNIAGMLIGFAILRQLVAGHDSGS